MANRVRFFLDQHIPRAVAEGLRRRMVEVLTAQEADRCGHSDVDQLQWALANGYVIVTFDDDFLALASTGIEHAGIAYCSASKHRLGDLIQALLLLHDVLHATEMQTHVEYL